MSYAIVKNSIVSNIVEWDGVSEFSVDGDVIVCDENAYIGGTYDNGFVARPVEPSPEPTYDQLRKNEYPSIGDQLDMQYWDSVNGTTTWKDHIASVKDQFPKV